jgi:hypothetical protein
MAGGQNRDTHHTVSAGILEALGKGLLIATGGLMAGILFGTTHLASLSLWTVAVAAASGAGCIFGSALVRNAGFDGCGQVEDISMPAVGAEKSMAATPGVEAGADVAPEDWRARRRVMASRERGRGAGGFRGV